jgi:hypothetical protein
MFMKKSLGLCALVFGAFLGSPSYALPILTNGGFEAPVAPTGSFMNEATSFPGWMVTTNNVDIVSGSSPNPPAFEGSQYLDLVGTGSTGGIAQSFNTTVGQTYALSFEFANNPNFSGASANVTVGSGVNDGSVLSNSVRQLRNA